MSDAPQLLLMRTLYFELANAEGTSLGFDLDGITSVSGDGTGCGVVDYQGPEGQQGLLVLNHEYVDPILLYPDGATEMTQAKVDKALAAHGGEERGVAQRL